MPLHVSKQRADSLNALAKEVWGHPEVVLKQDPNSGLSYIDVTQFLDAFEYLVGSGVESHQEILVRREYVTALEELETNAVYRIGAFVTGQPGIGKTLFLAYLLVVCLGKRRAVAWQLTTDYIMFTETAATFYTLHDSEPLDRHSPVWALSDSDDEVRSPSRTFYGLPRCVRTIQTTSPNESRWKEWSKQARAECYVMDIWSENEIADLALLGLDVTRMTALAKLWGGVPRRLLRFLRMKDSRIETEYRNAAVHAVQKCGAALNAIDRKDAVEEGPSKFYFCRPVQTESGIDRTLASSYVPTPTLRCLLGEALRTQDNGVKLTFFRALSQPGETRAAAGYIFESWFHLYISTAKSIKCNWVQGSGATSLSGVSSLIPPTSAAVGASKPPYYWIAPRNFPGVDGALVFTDVIYAFQVTVSSKHKTPHGGLQKLRSYLPDELKDLPWKVVFVGDGANLIETVARRWVGDLNCPKGQAMSIAWSEVDPVMADAPYREMHGESDLDDVSVEDVTE